MCLRYMLTTVSRAILLVGQTILSSEQTIKPHRRGRGRLPSFDTVAMCSVLLLGPQDIVLDIILGE